MRLCTRTLKASSWLLTLALFPVAARSATPLPPDQVTERDVASLTAKLSLDGAVHALEPPSTYIRRLSLLDSETLPRMRRSCAVRAMDRIAAGVNAAKQSAQAKGGYVTPLPDTVSYCQAILKEARTRTALPSLYANLALQEQGVPWYSSAAQATYLAKNEAGRTFQAVLTAAFAGQTTYTAISGEGRALPCPLALDAGFTWASTNATVALPLELTTAEARFIAQACYQTGSGQIMIRNVNYPAQKAGVIVGAWLARARSE